MWSVAFNIVGELVIFGLAVSSISTYSDFYVVLLCLFQLMNLVRWQIATAGGAQGILSLSNAEIGLEAVKEDTEYEATKQMLSDAGDKAQASLRQATIERGTLAVMYFVLLLLA